MICKASVQLFILQVSTKKKHIPISSHFWSSCRMNMSSSDMSALMMQHSQKLKEELKVIIQTLKVSLRQVQTFRTTVDDVFQFLSNGYADDGSESVESHQLRFQQKFIKE